MSRKLEEAKITLIRCTICGKSIDVPMYDISLYHFHLCIIVACNDRHTREKSNNMHI